MIRTGIPTKKLIDDFLAFFMKKGYSYKRTKNNLCLANRITNVLLSKWGLV